ncbi:DMSO/TMAO reductase YedYZ molybdopterin-dependent catalytic subunit [Nocardioides albertanoniae]|uniref:DMSO/TMAO reductase YedYZ molybdopterin-dependent catalytic subunit n=1 Tax=Nocardioides albertanoniae TaxID=1175486 RepID=A0A543A0U8_9ACTN|nr:molybdopterin-dependent oxidoreductase [Nocardioides albertanoniae]TQL66218.1 DMSO/TMAO reductase YedYZ molybdopterin-dependent catalytic subunit [Nocardioides albertanoniae]
MTETTRPRAILPPGQRAIDFFPRFGRRIDQPPPTVPAHPTVTFGGAVAPPIEVPVDDLVGADRRVLDADFHCVAGWSVTGLRWEGVAFADVYRRYVAPALPPGTTVTHLMVRGLDGEHFLALLDDLLSDDVFLADRLDGRPLDGTHGAPLRLVNPAQYGYANIKHVCRVDALAGAPAAGPASLLERLLQSHPRARVWEEERHGTVPGRLVRPIYRAIKTVLLAKAGRGE